MRARYTWLPKLRYYSNVSIVYVLTIAFLAFAIHPQLFEPRVQTAALTRAQQQPQLPHNTKAALVAGRPVRIVIPDSHVDLPVDEGYYSSATNSWTLSGYRAQFAMISSLANNQGGDTFIYGHNNNYVFGALRHVTPASGAPALIYTENGHIFAYKFQSVSSLEPNDTTVLTYDGPPILTIQTCTGSLDEWRTMYRFDFDKVEQ